MSTHEHICSRNFCIGQHKLHREDHGPIPDKVYSLPTIGKAKNQSRTHLLRFSRSLCSAGECLAWIISATNSRPFSIAELISLPAISLRYPIPCPRLQTTFENYHLSQLLAAICCDIDFVAGLLKLLAHLRHPVFGSHLRRLVQLRGVVAHLLRYLHRAEFR